MSTNKTQNYSLHAWVRDDKFLMDEMNENFAKLDEDVKADIEAINEALADQLAEIQTTVDTKADAGQLTAAKTALENSIKDLDSRKAQFILGTYQGTGVTGNRVELGKKPIVVHIERADGYRSQNYPYGGLATQTDFLGTELSMDDTGFTLLRGNHTNESGRKYIYMAFVESDT